MNFAVSQHSDLSASRTASMLLLMAGLALISTSVMAGAGGVEFDDVWAVLVEWTEGTLGRIVAIVMILVGVIGGIARQSLFAFVTGIAGGMGLYNAPTIVESVMTATLASAGNVTATAMTVGNGLGG